MRHFLHTLAIAALLIAGGKTYAQCTDPVPSVVKITNDSVTLQWPVVSGALRYEYAVQLSSASQPSSGTPTTNTSVGVANLPYAAHKAWVRTDCGGGIYSNWASIAFTIVCGSVSSITVANITQISADISWPPVADIQSYEYLVNPFSTLPPGAGTPVTGYFQSVPSLSPGTEYYAHVRTDCGGGTYSNWTTQKFVTKFSLGIDNVDVGEIKAFPNPFFNAVNIDLGTLNDGVITVMNGMGAIVHREEVTQPKLTIDMSGQPSGIYFVRYTSDEYQRVIKLNKL